mgnify:CR=1 FL=1
MGAMEPAAAAADVPAMPMAADTAGVEPPVVLPPVPDSMPATSASCAPEQGRLWCGVPLAVAATGCKLAARGPRPESAREAGIAPAGLGPDRPVAASGSLGVCAGGGVQDAEEERACKPSAKSYSSTAWPCDRVWACGVGCDCV